MKLTCVTLEYCSLVLSVRCNSNICISISLLVWHYIPRPFFTKMKLFSVISWEFDGLKCHLLILLLAIGLTLSAFTISTWCLFVVFIIRKKKSTTNAKKREQIRSSEADCSPPLCLYDMGISKRCRKDLLWFCLDTRTLTLAFKK